MPREDLVEKIANSLCNSVDQKTLLQLFYDDQYSWLDSLSNEELLDQAFYILNEEVTIED